MKVNVKPMMMPLSVLVGPVVLLAFLQVVLVTSSPVISDGARKLHSNSGIDPIRFVRKSLGEDHPISVSTVKPETATTSTHSPGLRSLSAWEPDLNEVGDGGYRKTERNPYDKYLRSHGDNSKDGVGKGPHAHSRSKRSLLFLAFKKLIKFKILLLG